METSPAHTFGVKHSQYLGKLKGPWNGRRIKSRQCCYFISSFALSSVSNMDPTAGCISRYDVCSSSFQLKNLTIFKKNCTYTFPFLFPYRLMYLPLSPRLAPHLHALRVCVLFIEIMTLNFGPSFKKTLLRSSRFVLPSFSWTRNGSNQMYQKQNVKALLSHSIVII